MIGKLIKNKLFVIGAIIVLAVGGFYLYNSTKNKVVETSYVLGVIEKGTIINSISGTGQVSSYSEGDVKSSASGDIISLKVSTGKEVKKGDVMAVIDSSVAQKTVRDAETSLESAKLSLEKTKAGLSDKVLATSEMSIESKRRAILTAENDLEIVKKKASVDIDQAYDNAIIDLNDSISKGLSSLYFVTDLQYSKYNNNTQDGFKIAAAKAEAVKSFLGIEDGRTSTISSLDSASGGIKKEVLLVKSSKDKDTTDNLLTKMIQTLGKIRTVLDVIPMDTNLTSSERSSVISEQNNIDNKIASITAKQQAILSQKNTNENNIDAANKKIEDAKISLTESEKQLSLDKIVDPYDIETQELSVKQREDALYDAKKSLNDYYVKAPFSGVVAVVSAKVGDNVSASSSIATVITKEQIAQISLNEVDIAKVKVGQKVTLTFDSVADLTIAGEVIEVGAIGTASQGVVSYSVKIMFSNQDERIKSGMSTSASIITSAKQDVLMLPSSAIKSNNGSSYVLSPSNENIDSGNISTSAVLLKNKPVEKNIEVGESNDSYTEVLSGLTEGDVVIMKSVTSSSSSSKTSTTQGQSLFNFGGGGNRAGGAPTGGTTTNTNRSTTTR